MRVAFVSTVHGHTWPASELLWSSTASRLIEQGHQVYVRCSEDFEQAKTLRSLIRRGLIYERVTAVSSRTKRLKALFIDPMAKLRSWNADVVVVSAGSAFDISYDYSLLQYLLDTQAPFIPICHFNAETFLVDGLNRIAMKHIYERAAMSVFVSKSIHQITERQLAKSIDNVRVLRPPLPVQIEEPLPWPEPAGDSWNLACVARLEPRWKGQDVLFEVFSKPEWHNRNWQLNLYGEGRDHNYLRSLANFYGIENKINFRGFVEDRLTIWRNNHLQVLSARGEGGPMVLTEGMICGRPVVITDCGNVKEYVNDGDEGFIADFATPKIFSLAMERAWAVRDQWKDMGLRAHMKIMAARSNSDCGVQLLEIIKEVAR